MTARIYTLPQVNWNFHQNEPDTSPCECDPCEPIRLADYLSRPPRSKPVLRVDNTRRDER